MRRAGGIALVAVLVTAAFFIGLLATSTSDFLSHPAPAGEPTRGRDPSMLDEVRRELERGYYRPVGRDVLAAGSIPEMLKALDDPNTDHLTAAEYETLRRRTAKSYSGVGLTVEPAGRGLLVTSTLAGPAKEAGIRPGDVIVGIDGQKAGDLSFDESLALIKGEQGTPVRLTVKRPNKGRRIEFDVVRSDIPVPSLRARLLAVRGTPVAYVRLFSFPEGAAARLEQRTSQLVAKGAEAVILDLRDNPGGLLWQAIQTVSVFLEDGIVCTTSGLHEEPTAYEVVGHAAYPEIPLVVLVNGGSASAAEIVAAALGEHGRATVVGRHTYGKASVQSIRPLSNGTALKLTTASYITPTGVDLARRGVLPDVRALDDPRTPADEAVRVARAAVLADLRQSG